MVAGQRPLNMQTPNSNAPIGHVDVDVTGMLTDGSGKPVTGRLMADAYITAAWRYLFNFLSGGAIGRVQRAIRSAGDLPIRANDSILNISVSVDITPSIPLANTRNGAPLTFKNLPGFHTQTLVRSGSDGFDGVTTYTLNAGSSVTLVPFNDGFNIGWAIE